MQEVKKKTRIKTKKLIEFANKARSQSYKTFNKKNKILSKEEFSIFTTLGYYIDWKKGELKNWSAGLKTHKEYGKNKLGKREVKKVFKVCREETIFKYNNEDIIPEWINSGDKINIIISYIDQKGQPNIDYAVVNNEVDTIGILAEIKLIKKFKNYEYQIA